MCAADSSRERDSRVATRIYHSHSRSRQLLSLPLSPSAVPKPARYFALSRPLARFHCSTARLLKALAVLASAFASVVVLNGAAPSSHLLPSVAGGSAGAMIGKTVLVERPAMVREHSGLFDGLPLVDHPPSKSAVEPHADQRGNVVDADETVVYASRQGTRAENDHTSTNVSAHYHPESVSDDTFRFLSGEINPTGALRGEASTDSGAQSASLALDEEAEKDSDQFYRDPADFTTMTNNTALNYFHLHKTGGVSFKERLFDFFILYEKFNDKGQRAKVVDTCHMSGHARPALGTEAKWSCDWGEIETMPEEERRKIDVVLGHQYWERGAGYWVPNRDFRYFTVMRHPLHRKVSFFYHFFVRNSGRLEESVSENELIQFILGKEMPSSPLVRDAGPGYYASRLWSDGLDGYGQYNKFLVPEDGAEAMVFNSIRRLRRNFVFIGLQTQEKASLCMLEKTVKAFAKAHGYSNLKGLDEISKQRERLNTGSYALSGEIIWNKMTEEQREEFKRIERVDLAIYRESVKMFREMVKKFECSEFVVDSKADEIAV